MKIARALSLLSAAILLVSLGSVARAADPGLLYPTFDDASDQKAGSILFFNIYTSSIAAPATQNTRVNITNTHDMLAAFVHLFFVEGSTCSVSDRYICLTANQTMTFLTSEQDPGTTGYIVALASDGAGLPAAHDFLIGDEYVKFDTGHFASFGADAYTKLSRTNIVSTDGTLAALFFDGLGLNGSYSRAGRVLAVDNIGDRASGNDTLLILNRMGGNLTTSANTLGTLFGILYDDAEQSHSFSFSGACQFRSRLTNDFPKTTPRFEVVIPAGQSGWMKVYSPFEGAMSGVVINRNAAGGAGSFNEGHSLHRLKLTGTANYVVPIFPPGC